MSDHPDNPDQKIREYLKVLLLHLAAKCENPAIELQTLLQEVIEELHRDVKKTLAKNRRQKVNLKLV